MNDTCLMPAARTPNTACFNATITTLRDSAAKQDIRLGGATRAVARMAGTPRHGREQAPVREQVIRSLGALGMDRVSASTFVDMTEQLFVAPDAARDA